MQILKPVSILVTLAERVIFPPIQFTANSELPTGHPSAFLDRNVLRTSICNSCSRNTCYLYFVNSIVPVILPSARNVKMNTRAVLQIPPSFSLLLIQNQTDQYWCTVYKLSEYKAFHSFRRDFNETLIIKLLRDMTWPCSRTQ